MRRVTRVAALAVVAPSRVVGAQRVDHQIHELPTAALVLAGITEGTGVGAGDRLDHACHVGERQPAGCRVGGTTSVSERDAGARVGRRCRRRRRGRRAERQRGRVVRLLRPVGREGTPVVSRVVRQFTQRHGGRAVRARRGRDERRQGAHAGRLRDLESVDDPRGARDGAVGQAEVGLVGGQGAAWRRGCWRVDHDLGHHAEAGGRGVRAHVGAVLRTGAPIVGVAGAQGLRQAIRRPSAFARRQPVGAMNDLLEAGVGTDFDLQPQGAHAACTRVFDQQGRRLAAEDQRRTGARFERFRGGNRDTGNRTCHAWGRGVGTLGGFAASQANGCNQCN